MDYSASILRSYITTADNVLSVVKSMFEAEFTLGGKDFSVFDWEFYGGAIFSQTKTEKNGVDRFLTCLEIPDEAKKPCEELKKACKLVCIHVDYRDRYYIQGLEWEILSEQVEVGTYFRSTKCNDEMIISGLSRSPVLILGQSPIVKGGQLEIAE